MPRRRSQTSLSACYIIACTFFITAAVVFSCPSCHAAEIDALRSLFTATGGTSWRRATSWLSNATHYCQWYGISCAATRVTEIDLSENNLGGDQIAAVDWSSFTELQFLLLHHNNLEGVIPYTATTLPKIKNISLHVNQFSELPPDLVGASTSLQFLTLSGNLFWCPLPTFVTNATTHVPQLQYTDFATTTCVRTRTPTVEVSPTLVVEPPLVNYSYVPPGRYIETLLLLSDLVARAAPTASALDTALAKLTVGLEDLITGVPSDGQFRHLVIVALSPYEGSAGAKWVAVNFNANVSYAARNLLLLKLRNNHVSVLRLHVRETLLVLNGAALPTLAPTTPEPTLIAKGIVLATKVRTAVILAAVVIAVFVLALGAFFFFTGNPAYAVKQAPGSPPLPPPPPPPPSAIVATTS